MAAAAPVRRRRKLAHEINVVPYIDVMLVLLIIFMITAPLLAEGVKVELPKAGARPIPPDMLKDSKPIVLTVDDAGRLYLNYGGKEDEPIDAATVESRAAAVLRRAPETAVRRSSSAQPDVPITTCTPACAAARALPTTWSGSVKSTSTSAPSSTSATAVPSAGSARPVSSMSPAPSTAPHTVEPMRPAAPATATPGGCTTGSTTS